jgi:hypothetical protein
MERSFGEGFGDVRVHADSAHARGIGAVAFTQGSAIHFAPGQYAPDSTGGRELLGHELAHVVQQRAGRVGALQARGLPINDDTGLEAEADHAGQAASRGETAQVFGAGLGTQRKLDAEAPIQAKRGDSKSEEAEEESEDRQPRSKKEQRKSQKAMRKGLAAVDQAFALGSLSSGDNKDIIPAIRKAATKLPEGFEVDLLKSHLEGLADALAALEPLDTSEYQRHFEKTNPGKIVGQQSVGKVKRQKHHAKKSTHIGLDLLGQADEVVNRLKAAHGNPIRTLWGSLARDLGVQALTGQVETTIERVVHARMAPGVRVSEQMREKFGEDSE